MRRLIAGLVLATMIVVGAAVSAEAQQLPCNTWVNVPTTYCLQAQANYGPYLGVIGYAKVDVHGWNCPGSWVSLVTVTGDNVLHNKGPCNIGVNSTNSLDHYSCVSTGGTSGVEQVQTVFAPTEQAFGMHVQTCDPPGAGGHCTVRSFSVLG
jgi:hypothetical protein